MSLKDLANSYKIVPHKTSAKEILNLMAVVDREISDARQAGLSDDGRFTHSYMAALQLCTILLYASGYKAGRVDHHHTTIMTLPYILGDSREDDANYLDTCRNKRNEGEYRFIGTATPDDADELFDFVVNFQKEVIKWFKQNHPELLDK